MLIKPEPGSAVKEEDIRHKNPNIKPDPETLREYAYTKQEDLKPEPATIIKQEQYLEQMDIKTPIKQQTIASERAPPYTPAPYPPFTSTQDLLKQLKRARRLQRRREKRARMTPADKKAKKEKRELLMDERRKHPLVQEHFRLQKAEKRRRKEEEKKLNFQRGLEARMAHQWRSPSMRQNNVLVAGYVGAPFAQYGGRIDNALPRGSGVSYSWADQARDRARGKGGPYHSAWEPNCPLAPGTQPVMSRTQFTLPQEYGQRQPNLPAIRAMSTHPSTPRPTPPTQVLNPTLLPRNPDEIELDIESSSDDLKDASEIEVSGVHRVLRKRSSHPAQIPLESDSDTNSHSNSDSDVSRVPRGQSIAGQGDEDSDWTPDRDRGTSQTSAASDSDSDGIPTKKRRRGVRTSLFRDLGCYPNTDGDVCREPVQMVGEGGGDSDADVIRITGQRDHWST